MRVFWAPFWEIVRFMQKDSGFRFVVTIVFLIILFLGIVIFMFMKKSP